MGSTRQISLGWGSLALLLAAAALSGGGVGAFLEGAAPGAAALQSSGKARFLLSDHIEPAHSKFILRDPITLPVVAPADYDSALASMALSVEAEQQLRGDIERGRVRLLWLTLWDWDTQTESGDTISITADDYHRVFRLASHRTRIAIPEPRSGTIDLRGELSEDGIIAISFLTGSRPIALPHMSPGESVKLEIDPQ